MHEMSLASALLRQVDRVLSEQPAGALTAVRVEAGPLTGVEPLLLASAFEQLTKPRFVEPIEFILDEVPLQARCGACQQSCEIVDFVFRCSHCDSDDVRITGGDSLQLVSISLRPFDSPLEPA